MISYHALKIEAHKLWGHRHFMLSSISGEIKRRFIKSKFGTAWFILQPLLQSIIYAVVLSELMAARMPEVPIKSAFAIYLMAGMAAWGLFSEIVTRCTTVFIEYSALLKKISFPRLCLVGVVCGTALLNHIILLAVLAIVTIFLGRGPTIVWALLPISIILIMIFAVGLGLLVGIFNVFLRDINQILNVALQIWFWLTPIIYVNNILPKHLRWINDVNPITPLVDFYQRIMLYQSMPNWPSLIMPAIVAVSLLALALLIFSRASADLVDEL